MVKIDEVPTFLEDKTSIIDIIDYTRVYLALGDTLWAFALALLLDVPFDSPSGTIIFLTIFGVYALNNRTDNTEDEINLNEGRWVGSTTWAIAGSFSLISASIVALVYRPLTILAVIWTVLWFILYSVPILPNSFRYQRLKEVPIAKNLTIAVGLGGLFFILFLGVGAEATTAMVVLFSFVAGRFIIGSMIRDVADVEGDILAGVRTIVVLIGVHQTKRLLFVLNFTVTLIFYGSIALGILNQAAILPGLINMVSFVLIGILNKDNAENISLLTVVNDTYVFFLLAVLSSLTM